MGRTRRAGRTWPAPTIGSMPLVMNADEEGSVDRAARALADGGLVVAPLDGVYALLADAFVAEATARLRSVRQVAADRPLTLLVRTRYQLSAVASSVSEPAERLIAAFWPGPLTLILPAAETITVDLGATRGTVAVRMPVDERATALVAASGPLACSTAVPAGQTAPVTVDEPVHEFGDAVQAYLDAGQLDGARSTVVDCSRGGAEVRRRGAISADEIIDAAAGAETWDPVGGAGPPREPTDPGVQE